MNIVKVLNEGTNELPKYETMGSAGMDVRADFSKNDLQHPVKVFGAGQFVPANEVQKTSCLYLEPGSRALIPTGLSIGLPEGFECQVRPRSGLALKEGVSVLNTPGTIDCDYNFEIGVILMNFSNKVVCIEHGERIAQLVFNKVETITWHEVDNRKLLGSNTHGNGFGGTGKK